MSLDSCLGTDGEPLTEHKEQKAETGSAEGLGKPHKRVSTKWEVTSTSSSHQKIHRNTSLRSAIKNRQYQLKNAKSTTEPTAG